MRKIFYIAILLLAITSCGQKLTGKVQGLNINTEKQQHSLTMFFGNLSEESTSTAIFIDGKQGSFMELLCINSKFIDTYLVEKKAISINGKEYKEQLYITTKDNYISKPISINDIRKKYAKDQNLSCLYFIDGRITKVDEVDIFLDENNILEICCHLYNNIGDNLKLNIIEIFTRSDENLKKANDIIIR